MSKLKYTYKEAYDKIIDAYFKNEIQPFNAEFCFCGTLVDGNCSWVYDKVNGYEIEEFSKMEWALYQPLTHCGLSTSLQPCREGPNPCGGHETVNSHKDYEDKLFEGMCAALEVLKDIHEEHGENVEKELLPTFVKRQKQLI